MELDELTPNGRIISDHGSTAGGDSSIGSTSSVLLLSSIKRGNGGNDTVNITSNVRLKWWYRPLVNGYSALSGSDLESSRMYVDTTVVPLYNQLKSSSLLPEAQVLRDVIGMGLTPLRMTRRRRKVRRERQREMNPTEENNQLSYINNSSTSSTTRTATTSLSSKSTSRLSPQDSDSNSSNRDRHHNLHFPLFSRSTRSPTSTSDRTSTELFQQMLPLALICSSLTAFILPLYDGIIIYYIRWIMTLVSAIIGPRLTGGMYPSLGVLIFGLMVNKPLAVCTMALAAWVTFFLALVMTKALGLGSPLDEF